MSTPLPYLTYPSIPKGVITRQPDASQFTSNRDGTCTRTDTYKGNYDDLITSPLSVQGSNHPTLPTLVVWSSKVIEGKGGIGTLVIESRGALGGLPEPTYTTDRATHNEPIATHPLWVSQIAGKPSAPLNGAIFVDPSTQLKTTDDTKGVFKDWSTGSIFAGVSDYLLAGSTFNISYADYNAPDLSGVGQLASPENAPAIPEGFFWLYTGASSSQHGNIYRITETYLLTGGVNQQATTILYGSN